MYGLGERYDIPELKRYARDEFSRIVLFRSYWPHFSWTKNLIFIIYTTTPTEERGLRDIVMSACGREVKYMLVDVFFKDLMDESPDFRDDLMLAAYDRISRVEDAERKAHRAVHQIQQVNQRALAETGRIAGDFLT